MASLRPPSQAASAASESGAPPALERYRAEIEAELRRVLTERGGQPYGLMRYHLGWENGAGLAIPASGGKLLRPALCLLCCEAAGGDRQAALPAAAALELLHNFTLIHDDVEDASERRHGRETLWSVRGMPQAINAGDGMFALAHVALQGLLGRGHRPERALAATRLLDEAALRLCEGQHLDLAGSATSLEAYLAMIEGKTAALLAASCAIGALLAGAPEDTVEALGEFGRRLGLAFQVRDDLLGIWGADADTGKSAGDDLRAGKRSFPVVLALERASADERVELLSLLDAGGLSDTGLGRATALLERLGAHGAGERAAVEHAEAAVAALDGLDLQPERRDELEALARFAAQRSA